MPKERKINLIKKDKLAYILVALGEEMGIPITRLSFTNFRRLLDDPKSVESREVLKVAKELRQLSNFYNETICPLLGEEIEPSKKVSSKTKQVEVIRSDKRDTLREIS